VREVPVYSVPQRGIVARPGDVPRGT
jgi:hypothetical protein